MARLIMNIQTIIGGFNDLLQQYTWADDPASERLRSRVLLPAQLHAGSATAFPGCRLDLHRAGAQWKRRTGRIAHAGVVIAAGHQLDNFEGIITVQVQPELAAVVAADRELVLGRLGNVDVTRPDACDLIVVDRGDAAEGVAVGATTIQSCSITVASTSYTTPTRSACRPRST